MIVKYPDFKVVDFLLSLDINPDEVDYDETTPFTLVSKNAGLHASLDHYDKFRKSLIASNVRIDYPDIKGRTPFLNYYEQ